MSLFADPPNTTAETIAVYLDARGTLSYPTPAAVTAEDLADDIEGISLATFADNVLTTPEEIAVALNSALGGITSALRHWRSW